MLYIFLAPNNISSSGRIFFYQKCEKYVLHLRNRCHKAVTYFSYQIEIQKTDEG